MPHTSRSRLDASLQVELDELREAGLLRRLRQTCGRQGPRMTVDGRDVLMVAGANYLGLAADPRVVQAARDTLGDFGCAAGSARLISGNYPQHEALEQELASFLNQEAALLFSSGYMANLGVISALAGPQDVILSDRLNHASIIDACRMSGAETKVFRHNDVQDFVSVARTTRGYRRRLLVVDGVFSMDGNTSALHELVPEARRHDMIVVVDDAHGCGVLGEHGRGTAELHNVEVDVQLGNLGKALGSFGAFAACSERVREYLINCCRTFVFTCGLPPSVIAAARRGLEILAAEPDRRTRLLSRAAQLRGGLQRAGYDIGKSTTHIVPAIVGENRATMELCEAALLRGVYAQGIRYPSVPRGTARIRFTPTCEHTSGDMAEVIRVLAELKQPAPRA